MKQIWKMALALAMAVTLVQGYPSANGRMDVKADETYPMGCGNFEVAYVRITVVSARLAATMISLRLKMKCMLMVMMRLYGTAPANRRRRSLR